MVIDCHNEVVLGRSHDNLVGNDGNIGSDEERYEVKGPGSRKCKFFPNHLLIFSYQYYDLSVFVISMINPPVSAFQVVTTLFMYEGLPTDAILNPSHSLSTNPNPSVTTK